MRILFATILSLSIALFSTSSLASSTSAIIYTKLSNQTALDLEQINKVLTNRLEKQFNSIEFKSHIARENHISVDKVGYITVSHAKLTEMTDGKYMLTYHTTSVLDSTCSFINKIDFTNPIIEDIVEAVVFSSGLVGTIGISFLNAICDIE